MLSSLIRNSSRKVFPNFITGSRIIKSDTEITKVFPTIGLANSSEPIEVKFDFSDVQLDKVIHLAIKKFLDSWREDPDTLARLKGLEMVKMAKTVYVLEELNRRFNKKESVGTVNDKVVLTKSIPSYDGKPLIRAGTDLFKLTKQLLEYGQKYVHVDLVSAEDMSAQCKNMSIVFSSDGLDGAWDIATMSMRGVKSCMRWEARQSPALVGSITDPCCGLIYLTNNAKTIYGPKMLFRAVVRLVIHRENLKPLLLVDRVYSSFYKNKPNEVGKFDKQVKTIFIEHLQKKIPNCQVADAQAKSTSALAAYMIPRPLNFNMLVNEEKSYRDTPIEYSDFHDYETSLREIKKNLGIKEEKKVATKAPKKRARKAVKSNTTF